MEETSHYVRISSKIDLPRRTCLRHMARNYNARGCSTNKHIIQDMTLIARNNCNSGTCQKETIVAYALIFEVTNVGGLFVLLG